MGIELNLISGIVLGAFGVWLVARSQIKTNQEKIEILESSLVN